MRSISQGSHGGRGSWLSLLTPAVACGCRCMYVCVYVCMYTYSTYIHTIHILTGARNAAGPPPCYPSIPMAHTCPFAVQTGFLTARGVGGWDSFPQGSGWVVNVPLRCARPWCTILCSSAVASKCLLYMLVMLYSSMFLPLPSPSPPFPIFSAGDEHGRGRGCDDRQLRQKLLIVVAFGALARRERRKDGWCFSLSLSVSLSSAAEPTKHGIQVDGFRQVVGGSETGQTMCLCLCFAFLFGIRITRHVL